MAEPAVMQRENERNRIVVEGKRTDDGDKCTVVVVHEVIGDWWAIYPHGFDKFGVRLSKAEAVTVAREILASVG